MIRIAVRAVALAAALAGAAQAQEAAVTRRATQLRDGPADSARSLSWLPADAPVTRGSERQGAWVQVRTGAGATGWVRLFDLAPAGAADAGGGSVVGGALRGVTRLLGNDKPVHAATTAGIRGLGAEDLARAQPNPAAVTQMERLRQSEADARAFADAAALRPVVVAPLAAPTPAVIAPPAATAPPAGQPGTQVAP